MRFIVITLTLIFLSACATKPVSTMEASPVPESRIINSQYTQKSPDKGILLVKRDSGWNTGACSARIYVSGSAVADIRTSEKIYIYLSPGDYNVGAIANGICAGGLVEIQVTIEQGKTDTVRISYGSNGEFKISPTSF